MDKIEYGYCHCGCGKKTKLAKQTDTKRGRKEGEPVRFIPGHNMKGIKGKDHPKWKGGRYINKIGNERYVMLRIPEHPRGHIDGYVFEHIIVVEKVLGFPIGEKAVIHHIDNDGLNNDLSNLMVFKNNSEHMKFHRK